jgi:hypothetical protein
MKKLWQILGWLIFVGILLVAFSLVYSTVRGNMTWYFRVNGQVTVDGHKTTGYMHANTQRTVLLLTRTDGPRPETYLVPVSEDGAVLDCGDWHPVRFLPIATGDVNRPCLFPDSSAVADAPIEKTVVRGRTSVEFSTLSGKKIKAEW